MSYSETKVYFDGSHYIAIPHTTKPSFRRPKPVEETITVVEENDESSAENLSAEPSVIPTKNIQKTEKETNSNLEEKTKIKEKTSKNTPKTVKNLTKKEFFNELYAKYINLPKKKRKEIIYNKMLPYFKKPEHCKSFVEINMERKKRNLITRRIRMTRKANLASFNYFCTFTYDDKKHTEQSFKKGIKTCLRNLCYRKNWKYMGVWERAPKTNRLHFHGLFNIPKGTMPGTLEKVKDYDTHSHKMQTSIQSSYFNERFGRSDFKEIDENERRLGNALSYLMKYIEKTGEKIVYSKGLPQYFISDIMENDVVCHIGQEENKLLLYDDFHCINEGEVMGKVSTKVIAKMRKCNN